MPITRRALVATALAGVKLATPALAAEPAKTLRFVPVSDLPLVDPIVTSALATRNHAYMVFDTLYGLDAEYRPAPQMLEGHLAEDDNRRWTLRLRDGLKFHDGEPVLARDVVASLQRWSRRDSYGATLFAAADEVSASDDRTVQFRLKKPFAALPDALGKVSPTMAAIMPERLARTDPFTQVSEVIGSGPFRFMPGERVPGARVVYERFAGYVPRTGGAMGISSGPKRARVDRVEWTILPDPTTAANALLRNEVDWVEAPLPDLLPTLAGKPDIAVRVIDRVGLVPVLRFNCLNPPFDNPAIRRLVLRAVDQRQFLAAYSSDESILRSGVGVFPLDTPMANRAGMATLFGPTDFTSAREALKQAGYNNEPVLLLAGADNPVTSAASQVAADLLTRIGFRLEYVTVDSATVYQRRASRERVEKGGWSLFIVGYAGIDLMSPAVSYPIRGNGADAWFGWPTSPRLEQLRTEWLDAPDFQAQRRIAEQIQQQVWEDAPFVPLGQINQKTAYRRSISGVLEGFPKFYNVEKA